jgi:hypothetical protein
MIGNAKEDINTFYYAIRYIDKYEHLKSKDEE